MVVHGVRDISGCTQWQANIAPIVQPVRQMCASKSWILDLSLLCEDRAVQVGKLRYFYGFQGSISFLHLPTRQ